MTNICVLKTLFFVQAVVIFLRFSAHNLSLLLNFHFFIFINVFTTVNSTLIFGETYTWKEFSVSKVGS